MGRGVSIYINSHPCSSSLDLRCFEVITSGILIPVVFLKRIWSDKLKRGLNNRSYFGNNKFVNDNDSKERVRNRKVNGWWTNRFTNFKRPYTWSLSQSVRALWVFLKFAAVIMFDMVRYVYCFNGKSFFDGGVVFTLENSIITIRGLWDVNSVIFRCEKFNSLCYELLHCFSAFVIINPSMCTIGAISIEAWLEQAPIILVL